MSLPLAIILIPFALFLVLFLMFSLFNVFHLFRYGYQSTGLFIVTSVYILGTVLLLGGGYLILAQYNWNTPIRTTNVLEGFEPESLLKIPSVPLKQLEKENI